MRPSIHNSSAFARAFPPAFLNRIVTAYIEDGLIICKFYQDITDPIIDAYNYAEIEIFEDTDETMVIFAETIEDYYE